MGVADRFARRGALEKKMHIIRRLASVALVVGGVALGGGGAASDDVFTVSGVVVDVTAEAAASARTTALAEGQRGALDRLLRRITLRRDYANLPAADDTDIATMVQDISVEEEKSSSIRYLANLTVRFKPKAVRALLDDAGIPYTETRSKPLLVLPVYEAAGAFFLWDAPNPWRQAWSDLPANPDSLVRLVLPRGDLADVAAIGASQALAGDAGQLRAIARRYQVEDTLVVHAAMVVDLANNVPRLHIGLQRFGPSGESTLVEAIVGDVRDQVSALLATGVRQVQERLEERWKQDTLLRFDVEGRLSARVPLTTLADWLAVRERLRVTAIIRKIELAAISRADARLVLHYFGGAEQLVLSLAQLDLDLREEDGFWVMRLRGPGSAP